MECNFKALNHHKHPKNASALSCLFTGKEMKPGEFVHNHKCLKQQSRASKSDNSNPEPVFLITIFYKFLVLRDKELSRSLLTVGISTYHSMPNMVKTSHFETHNECKAISTVPATCDKH